MIELAFVVCFLSDPKQCEDRSLLFTDVPMMACVNGAQVPLAAWIGEHPGWKIDRWSCRMVDPTVAEL